MRVGTSSRVCAGMDAMVHRSFVTVAQVAAVDAGQSRARHDANAHIDGSSVERSAPGLQSFAPLKLDGVR